MCIGVPVRVVSVSDDGLTAKVVSRGEEHQLNLMMLDDRVNEGDYLVAQVGGFAVEKLEASEAEQALALIGALEEEDYERATKLY